MSIHML